MGRPSRLPGGAHFLALHLQLTFPCGTGMDEAYDSEACSDPCSLALSLCDLHVQHVTVLQTRLMRCLIFVVV